MSDLPDQMALAFAAENDPSSETSYLLSQLEVYNWGPFRGLHRAEFDRDGTAIIGPTGSGKTTLVDAFMTLLVSQPRYNLASTGGHESDRDLLSYVRGVLGGDGSDGREEVARPGKTITGICATYQSHEDTLRLGGLLWTDGQSNSTQDLKRRWFFSQAEDQSLDQWIRLLHEDGIRPLMKMGRESAGLRIFESKKAYLAHTRKFFDVGENAFTLLNRAAGLKQLNSIDVIFRELVLDDRGAFDRALEVAGEFDNLAGIHAELETARRQQESLVPVADESRKLEKARTKLQRFEQLKQIVPVWFAITGERLWTDVLKQIASDHEQAESQLKLAQNDEGDCQRRVESAWQRYQKLGGNVIGELQKTIEAQEDRVHERSKHAEDYVRMIGTFGLHIDLSEKALKTNQAALQEKRTTIERQKDAKQEATLTALSRQRDLQQQAAEIESSLRKVKERPSSNIPPKFQEFRDELAGQLGISESELPFLAELVEVKPNESDWRGAIERAVGSDRLRILVPEDHNQDALRWVNSRDNRLHVRLQKASAKDQPASFHSDGFTRKLNFKPHSLLAAAKRLLADRDLHCVDSVEALERTQHAITIQGMISGRRGKFEKQDQRRLSENWMTGFDNKTQVESLTEQWLSLQKHSQDQEVAAKRLQRELSQLSDQIAMIDQLMQLDFSTIDLPGAEAELSGSQERLKSMLDPDSDTSQAKTQYDVQREQLNKIREAISKTQSEMAVLDDRRSRAKGECQKAVNRIDNGLTDEQLALAKAKLPIKPDVQAEQLDGAERNATRAVDKGLSEQSDRVSQKEQNLVRLMGLAKRVDTGALADVGSDLDDIDHYLERLRVLNEEALPEKLKRFLDYLNRSSDQGVTQLLSGIAEEVDAIEQRIAELNQTLVKVNFRSQRYLQLQPQRIKHERLRSLESAIRKLRNAALKEDQGESHYKALQELVDILRDAGQNRRKVGSQALLDPRYRLEFYVVEVDRNTGDRSPPRSGSQSGSGGEKELMASHILTASLSYALCPAEATCPLYSTVVLDEAFSKSSPSAASRIIEALRVFRLHPIFVTPNKEIGLLKQHTRKVICVQRPKKEATLASISWETLEELANP